MLGMEGQNLKQGLPDGLVGVGLGWEGEVGKTKKQRTSNHLAVSFRGPLEKNAETREKGLELKTRKLLPRT